MAERERGTQNVVFKLLSSPLQPPPPVETVLHNHNSFLLNGFPFPFVFEAVDHRRLDDDPVNPLPRGAVR